MKCSIIIILFLLGCSVFGQTDYVVDIDDRNMALDLNSKAKEFINTDQYKEAANSLLESIAVDSLLRESYILIYQTWLADRSLKDITIEAIKKGKKIFSDDDELCFYLAEIHRINSQLPEAILEYTNATNYATRNGEDFYLVHYYYFNRGNCFLQMEMYDGALADYNYTIKLKPEFAAAFYNRGVCLFKKGKKQDACIDWNHALELGHERSKQYIDKYCNK